MVGVAPGEGRLPYPRRREKMPKLTTSTKDTSPMFIPKVAIC